VHPLTGPVYVEGAEPGDLLVADIVEVAPRPFGFTAQIPGFGFLRDAFPDPLLVKWDIADGWPSTATRVSRPTRCAASPSTSRSASWSTCPNFVVSAFLPLDVLVA
jgi:hypothetical protein